MTHTCHTIPNIWWFHRMVVSPNTAGQVTHEWWRLFHKHTIMCTSKYFFLFYYFVQKNSQISQKQIVPFLAVCDVVNNTENHLCGYLTFFLTWHINKRDMTFQNKRKSFHKISNTRPKRHTLTYTITFYHFFTPPSPCPPSSTNPKSPDKLITLEKER